MILQDRQRSPSLCLSLVLLLLLHFIYYYFYFFGGWGGGEVGGIISSVLGSSLLQCFKQHDIIDSNNKSVPLRPVLVL